MMALHSTNAMELEREKHLFAQWATGEQQAIHTLIEESYSMIYASLFRLTGGDEDLSADLCQETYRKAWKSLPTFRGKSRFTTWLYRIAYNTYLNYFRRPRRLTPLDGEWAQELPDESVPNPEEGAAEDQEALRMRREVLKLPDPLRFTVSARFWGEFSVKEIAQVEGITTVAVRKRLNKALTILRGGMEEVP